MSITGKRIFRANEAILRAILVDCADSMIQTYVNAQRENVLTNKCNGNGTSAISEQVINVVQNPSTVEKNDYWLKKNAILA